MKSTASFFVLILAASVTFAQTADKPSYYDNKRRNPEVVALAKVSGVNALSKIDSHVQFMSVARVFEKGTLFEIPHLLFVVERQSKRVWFINTPKFELHERFLPTLLKREITADENRSFYYLPDRRFILGTLSELPNAKGFVFEYWEGDKLTPEVLKTTREVITKAFYAPIRFKANSTWHEEVARSVGIKFVSQAKLIEDNPLMVLNTGRAVGRLVVVSDFDQVERLQRDDIALLKDVPLAIPPVAGVINERPSTMLSHVNVLTQNWNIPNLYLRDAERILAPWVGKVMVLKVGPRGYDITPASKKNIRKNARPVQIIKVPQPDLTDSRIRPLSQLRVKHANQCGAKAANLGEIRAKLSQTLVPDGFCIPFAAYYQFMQKAGINAAYLKRLEASFEGDGAKRRAGLLALQEKIRSQPLDHALVRRVVKQWQEQLGGKGVFARSSSNSEDLPNFSGAGLYTTVPNVTTAKALEEAIKTGWASVFNYEAYEARRVLNLPLDAVKMSVFVQMAVNPDSAGVLVTANPFDKTDKNNSYIAAKRGLGTRVVEGRKVAEQVLYNHRLSTIRVISRSTEKTALQFDGKGGVVEIALEGRQRVLSDDRVIRLASLGKDIQAVFGESAQDIEWAVTPEGTIFILQARPYLR